MRMKLECNQQVERLDLIVALLTAKATRKLTYLEEDALKRNQRELENYLVLKGE